MNIAVEAGTCPAFLTGGGKVGALIRSHDWAATSLGEPAEWPDSLRAAVSICLHSSFPTAIYWGDELRLLYNDAWAPIPAERHPWALGRPGREVWSDIWTIVGPQFERVLATGEGFSAYDQMLPMVRNGAPAETYWSYSFTPIRGDDGSVVGVFNQGHETTAAVIARRNAEAEIQRLGRMFAQAPGAVAILRGADHVFEFVNPAYEELVGRGDLTGRPVADALPEVVSQGFVKLLDEVYRSGQPFVGRAVSVMLERRAGEREERFLDFVYQPLIDTEGNRTGVFVQVADVTDAAKSEAALRASEAKFQAIANSIDQMIWSTRPDGYHDYFNDRWYEYTGAAHGTTDGVEWNQMFHPDDRDRAWEIWRNSLLTGEPYHIEYRLRHRSGEFRWVIGRAQCVRNDLGEITRWYGTCTDIHALKSAEEMLAEQARILDILNRTGSAIASEIDLERLVQSVTDAGVQLTDAEFGAFFYNVQDAAGESYTLYTTSGIDRERFASFPMPRNTDVFRPTFNGEGIVRSGDITLDPRYGRNAPYAGMPPGHVPVRSYLAVPVVSRSGAVVGGLFFGHSEPNVFTERSEKVMAGIAAQAAIAIDNASLFRSAQSEIQARKRNEVSLRESEEFSRSVVESSGDCITVLNLDGTIQFMNRNGRILTELGDADIHGKKWVSLLPRESRPQAEAAIVTAHGGGIGRFSCFAPTASGAPKWWDIAVSPARGADGQPARLVSIARDVSEQRQAEEARQLVLGELNHRVKNLFAIASGMVAMTARTATSVESMASVLRGRLESLAKAHELIRAAIKTNVAEDMEGASLETLVGEILKPHVDPSHAGQLSIAGSPVVLGVHATTSLALILHELATNAAKYGALSTPGGLLGVTWTLGDERLTLNWLERSTVRPEGAEAREGFGSKLARAAAHGQLGGEIRYEWREDGVHIRIDAPLDRLRR